MPKIPNPGSDKALHLGCKCPVMDNGHGRGARGTTDQFWINGECPLHSVPPEKASEFIRKKAMKRIGL